MSGLIRVTLERIADGVVVSGRITSHAHWDKALVGLALQYGVLSLATCAVMNYIVELLDEVESEPDNTDLATTANRLIVDCLTWLDAMPEREVDKEMLENVRRQYYHLYPTSPASPPPPDGQ